MLLSLYRSLYSYRGFILGSVQREFQARYRNSLFGALWPIFNPLSMIIVYTVIFPRSCAHVYRVWTTAWPTVSTCALVCWPGDCFPK